MKVKKFLRKHKYSVQWVRDISYNRAPLPDAKGVVTIQMYLTFAEYEKLRKGLGFSQ